MDADNISIQVADDSVFDACYRLAKRMDRDNLEAFYGTGARSKRAKRRHDPLDALIKIALSPSMHRILNAQDPSTRFGGVASLQQPHSFLEMDAQVQKAFQTFGKDFPTAIWTCCKKRCFAHITILPENSTVFNAAFKIYTRAEVLHNQIEGSNHLLPLRRPAHMKSSSIAYAGKVSPDGTKRSETIRQKRQRIFKEFVTQALGFLRGSKHASDGTPPPTQPFCIQSICQILGIQRNTLYKPVGGEMSVIDDAGVRQRKFRRIGSRRGYLPLTQLPNYKCGCDIPCFIGLSHETLQRLWEGFKAIAGELSPEEKEHRYLLNQMFCPLTNTSVRVCNKAVSQLYTISEALVASIRLIVHQMCEDPALEDFPARDNGMKRYRERSHPLNRFQPEIIEQVERHLEMILRPDPAAAGGVNTCRVYSPEINTQEKLRKLLADSIRQDVQEIQISPSSLQRMVESYLKGRGCRISFSQADHNACPMCKSLHGEILYLHYEVKRLSGKISSYLHIPRPMTEQTQTEFEAVIPSLIKNRSLKEYRNEEAIQELRSHNQRDARIRGWLKRFTDHLRTKENDSRDLARNTGLSEPFGWCQRKNRGLVTHQDDMTKVDLPHVVVESSADITRWRFDVNAHVNAVTGDCVVFSHEQGAGSKNSSSILELVLLDHILTCKGESIKVIVSDNASVGKNWLSTVVFPQYMVDQGLAEIVMIVFLENNHGKWLADMLFGQFQIRKRNSVILGIDGLLQEFETINRPPGSTVKGYAVNPLSCVDLAQVFTELGYDTKPPKEFGFKNRNVHFAAACTPEAKSKLSPQLQEFLINALPDDAGMVRLCSEPPNSRPIAWRDFDHRWVDVPAARSNLTTQEAIPADSYSSDCEVPLVVPRDKNFAVSGPGLVAKRTAEHVGFNGMSFREKMSFSELSGQEKILTKEAWPSGLLRAGQVGFESETLYCAPENWILRKPVRHYSSHTDVKARYPPRNLLNALFCHGPRSDGISVEGEERIYWTPKVTYREPPFPFEPGRSATEALTRLNHEHVESSKSVHVLHMLRSVFREMPGRDPVADVWLQKRATQAPPEAMQKYSKVVSILQKRDNVRPSSVLTVLQAFREDDDIKIEIDTELRKRQQEKERSESQIVKDLFEERVLQRCPRKASLLSKDPQIYEAELQRFSEDSATKRAVSRELQRQENLAVRDRAKVTSTLFEKSKLKPGKLDRFFRRVEKDKQRHAEEMKKFKEVFLPTFDDDEGLLPFQGPVEEPREKQSVE